MLEKELKYTISSKEIVDRIVADFDQLCPVVMQASYYDTKEYLLRDNKIAFRIRKEGEKSVATMKIGGSAEAGFHKREEINIDASGMALDSPDLTPFLENATFAATGLSPKGLKLFAFMKTDFIRRCAEISYGGSHFEMAIDIGKVMAGDRYEEIMEMELELLEGAEDSMVAFGEIQKEKYGLVMENKTKYSRGMNLYLT